MDIVERTRSVVRKLMGQIARAINGASGGRITPTHITVSGVLLHALIGWAIVQDRLVWAAIMLVFFGLMDTLDGELARWQKKATASGIVIDAAADRYKEGIIYASLAYYFAQNAQPGMVLVTVFALSSSFLITFVKTKGEAVLATHAQLTDPQLLNRSFGDETFLRFEIRMALLVIGLLSGWLEPILYVLAIGGLVSAIIRYVEVDHRLR